jgi:hypothetical protein
MYRVYQTRENIALKIVPRECRPPSTNLVFQSRPKHNEIFVKNYNFKGAEINDITFTCQMLKLVILL